MITDSLKASEIEKKWFVVDATDLIVGRLAAQVAMILRGKHKPSFTPHMDCGDHVIIINAEKVALTGKKLTDRRFYWHTGHPGGIKDRTMEKILGSRFPGRVMEKAIERMITRGPLGRAQMRNLHVYAGSTHPHTAQQPQVLDIAAMNPKNTRR